MSLQPHQIIPVETMQVIPTPRPKRGRGAFPNFGPAFFGLMVMGGIFKLLACLPPWFWVAATLFVILGFSLRLLVYVGPLNLGEGLFYPPIKSEDVDKPKKG